MLQSSFKPILQGVCTYSKGALQLLFRCFMLFYLFYNYHCKITCNIFSKDIYKYTNITLFFVNSKLNFLLNVYSSIYFLSSYYLHIIPFGLAKESLQSLQSCALYTVLCNCLFSYGVAKNVMSVLLCKALLGNSRPPQEERTWFILVECFTSQPLGVMLG